MTPRRTAALAVAALLLAAPAATAQRENDDQHTPRERRAHEEHQREQQAQRDRHTPEERRRHAAMSDEERRHVRDLYQIEAKHRDRLARLRQLHELAERQGNQQRMAAIERLHERQRSLYEAKRQRLQGRIGRADLRERAAQRLQRGHQDGLRRHGRQAPARHDQREERSRSR